MGGGNPGGGCGLSINGKQNNLYKRGTQIQKELRILSM